MAGKLETRNSDDWGEVVAKKTFVITLIGGILFVAASWIITR